MNTRSSPRRWFLTVVLKKEADVRQITQKWNALSALLLCFSRETADDNGASIFNNHVCCNRVGVNTQQEAGNTGSYKKYSGHESRLIRLSGLTDGVTANAIGTEIV